MSGCRGQCGPGRKLPGTFPFPTRLLSSDVSLFPLAAPELWILSSPAQLWAKPGLPPLCSHLFFVTKGDLVSPSPRHHPVHSVTTPCLFSCLSPGCFSRWLGSSGKLHSLSRCQPTVQGGDKASGGRAEGEFREKQMDKSPVVFLESRFPKTAGAHGRLLSFCSLPSHVALSLSHPGWFCLAQPLWNVSWAFRAPANADALGPCPNIPSFLRLEPRREEAERNRRKAAQAAPRGSGAAPGGHLQAQVRAGLDSGWDGMDTALEVGGMLPGRLWLVGRDGSSRDSAWGPLE